MKHLERDREHPRSASAARRFALGAIADDGIVLDLVTGNTYRARASALVAFRELARGRGVGSAADALAREYDVPRERALADVRALIARSMTSPAKEERPVSFEAVKNGFVMSMSGRRVLRADDETGRVSGKHTPDILRAAAPHVLTLQGHTVLHAAAVSGPSGVIAFVGPSGVGKSTLARTFAQEGYGPVSDDLVVLGPRRRVILDAERALRDWTKIAGRRPLSPLAGAHRRTAPLAKVFVVTRGARGSPPAITPLRGGDAISALLENAFVEIPDRTVWRRALAGSTRLAAAELVGRLRIPHGLGAMARAVRSIAPRLRA